MPAMRLCAERSKSCAPAGPGEFLRGAWREFGYVHLMPSAASVSSEEVRKIRNDNAFRTMFVAVTSHVA